MGLRASFKAHDGEIGLDSRIISGIDGFDLTGIGVLESGAGLDLWAALETGGAIEPEFKFGVLADAGDFSIDTVLILGSRVCLGLFGLDSEIISAFRATIGTLESGAALSLLAAFVTKGIGGSGVDSDARAACLVFAGAAFLTAADDGLVTCFEASEEGGVTDMDGRA